MRTDGASAIEELRTAARALRQLADELDRRADALGGTAPTPPLPEAARTVLGNERRPMRAGELFDLIAARGWAPLHQQNPRQSLKVALVRMVQRGQLVRVAEGLYALPETATQSAESTD